MSSTKRGGAGGGGGRHRKQRDRNENSSDPNPNLPSSSLHDDITPLNQRNRRYGNNIKPRFVKKHSEILEKEEVLEEGHILGAERESLAVEGDKLSVESVIAVKDGDIREILPKEGEFEVEARGEEIAEEVDSNDIVKRLEKMALGFEEVELSEEELRKNDQAQEDEILALESIYGENVYILDRQKNLRCFQVHVHIEAPNEELLVCANMNSSSSIEGRNDNFSYSFKVEVLPPLVLTCVLPKSYPSHTAPSFNISVQWLNSAKISSICDLLDSIWNEQEGQEVLYQWVEWLHSSTLLYLGFDKEITLGPYYVRHAEDKRVISGSVSPDIDIPLMKSYNDERRHENFGKNFHECCICFSEFVGSEFVKLPCQHFFCWKCMKTFCDIHIKEGTVTKILCPSSKCGGMIPPALLKRLLGSEEFEHWEALMLQKTLESMKDVTYCPRCEMICIEDEDQHAQCSKCYFSFCSLCMERRHVGVACMTPEMKLLILQDRQNSTQLKGDQRHREREMINELLSVREINRTAKQCPSCKMAISRTEGCNKMVCDNCGQYFCYRCNKAIDGYDHFRAGSCELFPPEAIQMWEERINERQIVGQIQAGGVGIHGHPCPNCKQINAKVGNNNHIFCWACQNHYCYSCGKMVRRSTQHYGPKGCKQHSKD